MKSLLAAFVFALLFSGSAFAQGAYNFTSQTAHGNGNAALMFDVTATTSLTIYRIGTAAFTAYTGTVEIWYRQGGLNNPPTGWTLAGQAQATLSATAPWSEIPLTLNINMAANETYGIMLITPLAGSNIGYSTNVATTPNYVGPDMIINSQGWGGGYLASASPPMSPANFPRGFAGTIWYDKGPTLQVAATTGSRPLLPPGGTPPASDGVEAGKFTIASNNQSPSPALTSITVAASGTGDDSLDFTEVAIYRDSGQTPNGVFNILDDILVATKATAFPANNGTLVFTIFTAEQGFVLSETRTYFVVVKMAPAAQPTRTYDFTVTDIDVNQGSSKAGLPSDLMEGVQIDGPTLTLTAQPGTVQPVYSNEQGPGGNGLEVAEFSIAVSGTGTGVLDQISITPSGTGNDATDFAEVAIYREFDATPNGFQHGTDVLIATHPNFPTDNGARDFAVSGAEQNFPASTTRTYYVVIKLSGTSANNATYNFEVTALGMTNTFEAGVPGGLMTGISILPPTLFFTDFTAPGQQTVFIGAQDVLMQAFSVSYPNGPDNDITTLTLRGVGGGHEVNDITAVRLIHDVNGDRLLDGGDVVIATNVFNLNNGQCMFTITGQPQLVAPATRDFLVVYDFNPAAPDAADFRCYIQVANASVAGTAVSGLPLPSSTGTPGAVINANSLAVALAGPASAQTVNAGSTGPTGDGLLLANITVQAPPNYAWTLTDLTFVAAGSGDPVTGFTEVALYQDTGNGVWNGAATDTLAANAATSFNATTNDVTFTLLNTVLAQNQMRRFFLVGKLSTSASAGQTFGARLDAMTASSATPGQVGGVPTADTTALMIDLAVLNVGSGPNKPANALRKAGNAGLLPMAQIRLAATNDTVLVSGLTFTTAGTGSWAADVDTASGFQLWVDDGDGVFDSGSDSLVAQAGGAALVTLSPSPPLSVPHAGSEDLWVVVNLLASAGAGASAAADTYSFSIQGPGDVAASGGVTVLLSGTAPPTSSSLGIIDFFVTDMMPTESLLVGGGMITLTGSGFINPVTLRIDGVVCPGTPVISGGGTQLTGLLVPARTSIATGLAIEVTSGGLPPEVLPQTFNYVLPKGSGGEASSGGGSCTSGQGTATWALVLLALLAVTSRAVYRRT